MLELYHHGSPACAAKVRPSFHPAIYQWPPGNLRDEMKSTGAKAWPQVEKFLAAERHGNI